VSFFWSSKLERRQPGGGGRAVAPWIFIHGTDIADGGLMVLFFVFFAIVRFFLLPPSEKNFASVLVFELAATCYYLSNHLMVEAFL